MYGYKYVCTTLYVDVCRCMHNVRLLVQNRISTNKQQTAQICFTKQIQVLVPPSRNLFRRVWAWHHTSRRWPHSFDRKPYLMGVLWGSSPCMEAVSARWSSRQKVLSACDWYP